MFSVICPTMWYGKELETLLPLLDDCEYVGEIIIINNFREATPDWFKIDWKKVTTITPPTNIYVSPAFNLGIAASSYKKIALIQDDIMFNPGVFGLMESFVTADQGCYAASGKKMNAAGVDMSLPHALEFIECVLPHLRGAGVEDWLSCLMFLHKDNFTPIPERLNIPIHYGEHWITLSHFKMKKPPKLLRNFCTHTSGSNQTTGKVPPIPGHADCIVIWDDLGI